MQRNAAFKSGLTDRARPGTGWLIAPVAIAALGFSVLAATGQDVIVTHGVSNFGEVKYDADTTHFDYVNPDAPKGAASGRSCGIGQSTRHWNQHLTSAGAAIPAVRQGVSVAGPASLWSGPSDVTVWQIE